MRSSTIVSVLLASGALATPVIDRRVLVTDEVVVTVTDYVTAGEAAAKVAVATPATTSTASSQGANPVAYQAPHAHHHYHQQPPKSAVAVVSTSQQSSSSKPYVAPVPVTTSTSEAQAYSAPTTSASPSPHTTATPSPVQSSASPVSDNNLPTTAVANLDSGSDLYKGIATQHHNIHRQNNSASALTWNDTLASYAETTAKSCVYAHSLAPGGGGYGQNIAAGIEPGQIARVVGDMWYNGEEPLYPLPYGNNNPDMGGFDGWGHYSQVVWSDSESVGCYTSTCFPAGGDPQGCKPDGSSYLKNTPCGDGYPGETVGDPAYFTVCNYYPPGNYAGEYSKVKAPGSMGTVSMNKAGVITGL